MKLTSSCFLDADWLHRSSCAKIHDVVTAMMFSICSPAALFIQDFFIYIIFVAPSKIQICFTVKSTSKVFFVFQKEYENNQITYKSPFSLYGSIRPCDHQESTKSLRLFVFCLCS